VVGTTPLYYNAMSAKVRQTLLLPEVMGRKTKADRAKALKHDPVAEFRDSMGTDGRLRGDIPNLPQTLLSMPAPAFKGAAMMAALDIPGTRKTEIGRLVSIPATRVPVWGIPRLKMDVVRSADMAKTPDVRTRAYLEEWCAVFPVSYVTPNLTAKTIVHLFAAAGIMSGIGDFRQEKGKGSYGLFRLVEGEDDEDFRRIALASDPEAQKEAIENPVCVDDETEAMLAWYLERVREVGKPTSAMKEAA
jgi:hypothetical protein